MAPSTRQYGGNAQEERNTGIDASGPESNEDAADSRSALARPTGVVRGVGNSELDSNRGNFLPTSDRPYHGDWKGRLETRPDDMADSRLRREAEAKEAQTIKDRDSIYSQHGNVGYAGNYQVNWESES